jgi:hypothetical protein
VVGSLRELLVFGNRLRSAVEIVVRLDHRGRRDMILSTGDQQQRCAGFILEVDGSGGVRIEFGERGLE